jgi:hypothetical protein
VIYLLLCLGIFFTELIRRRSGLVSVPGILAAVMILNELTIILYQQLGLPNTETVWLSFQPTLTDPSVQSAFVDFTLVIFAAFLGQALGGARRRAIFRQFVPLDHGHRSIGSLSKWFILASASICLVHLALIDHSKLWQSVGYQATKDAAEMGFGGKLSPLFLLPRFLAFPCIALGAICLSRREPLLAALCGAVAAYAIALGLAQSSRVVPLYFATAFGVALMIERRPISIVKAILLFLVVISALAVLKGRAQHDQGLSVALSTFIPGSVSVSDLYGLFLNTNAGGLITADGLIARGEYPEVYKLLSFSPLPSLIDRFSAIRDQSEIRINFYTPLNAFAESYRFGWGYLTLFLISIILWVHSSRTVERLRMLPITYANLVIALLVVVSLDQYSLRTSYRLLILSTMVSYVAYLLFRGRPRLYGSAGRIPVRTVAGD